jgi:predicted ATP-dependent endonuclease of OLD family
MLLDKLRLNNFRSFEDEQICFVKDLTILVGENNGGKSNTIDALRLIGSLAAALQPNRTLKRLKKSARISAMRFYITRLFPISTTT